MLSEVTGPGTECQQGASQQKDILTPVAAHLMRLSSRSARDHAPLPDMSGTAPAGAPVPPALVYTALSSWNSPCVQGRE